MGCFGGREGQEGKTEVGEARFTGMGRDEEETEQLEVEEQIREAGEVLNEKDEPRDDEEDERQQKVGENETTEERETGDGKDDEDDFAAGGEKTVTVGVITGVGTAIVLFVLTNAVNFGEEEEVGVNTVKPSVDVEVKGGEEFVVTEGDEALFEGDPKIGTDKKEECVEAADEDMFVCVRSGGLTLHW